MKKQKTDGKLSCAKLGIQGEASNRRYAKSYRKNKSQLTEFVPLEHMAPAFIVKMERKIEERI